MKDGFVTVVAVSPHVRVADVTYNIAHIEQSVRKAADDGAALIVCPELCVTSASCGDLFWQESLITSAEQAVARLVYNTRELDAVVVVGAPVQYGQSLFNCAVVLYQGFILGIVPKATAETHFANGADEEGFCAYARQDDIAFGSNLIFECDGERYLNIAVSVGGASSVPSAAHIVCEPCATPEIVGAPERRSRELISRSTSGLCAVVRAEAGWGESSTDASYGGQCLIAEKGTIIAESCPFEAGYALSQIDLGCLDFVRKSAGFSDEIESWAVPFNLRFGEASLTRSYNPNPFVPQNEQERAARCDHVFSIQAQGLARRLSHTHSSRVLLGVSGGLDSTLAALVCARAFDLIGLERSDIMCVTMPGFGTTKRTRGNAEKTADALGASFIEIPIEDAVRQHFLDIGHDENNHDVTYENSQARERTQILMDLANKYNALVVGTGDLSELALGWATYNGDHMSMYGVNGGVPKTLIRHVVAQVAARAEQSGDAQLASTLRDVLDTPVSPELLPATGDGEISQKTEDLVGPYELHDFFLYHMLRRGAGPKKLYRLARYVWGSTYDDETILTWLKTFTRRFFSQQFKRSCLPDGPAVGSVSLSPRAGLAMPSDVSSALWLAELEEL
ncbi:MAG: NAD(+) synthase [Atopobiaceae bacterium]|nr:NAD(+) synthase [Atopobiaceae bacterium]